MSAAAMNKAGNGEKYPLMRRVITFSAALFLITLLAGSIAFVFSMQQITKASKRHELSQMLEIERIKLETYVNAEIALTLKLADSPLIRRYFTNPGDLELQKTAREEIASYRNAFAGNSIFWINDIDRIFYSYFHSTTNITYWLDINNPDNYWYPRALYGTGSYSFTINYNPDLYVTNLWIYAPVFDAKRKPIGVVGTSFELSRFIDMIYQAQNSRAGIYFFNARGEITGAENIELVLAKKNIEEALEQFDIGILAKATNLQPGETQVYDASHGIIALGMIPALEWYSVAFLPHSLTLADFKNSMTVLFLVVLVLLLLIVIIFNVFIFRFLRSLQETMDSLEIASNAKSSFLATVSHEIRTPMNSIMGFAELALDKVSEPQSKDYLSKIRDSAKWLLNIINDLLDISKIESGKMELEKRPFCLYEVVARCQSVALPSVIENGLDLRVYEDPIEGKKLLGDSVRLYQVLMNLLSNAVKFTKAGTVKLSTLVKSSDDSHTTVYFEVKDSGMGMTPEQVKVIFDPFTQADSSITRNYGGTGLGLAITKNIVELMGGTLAVESSPGSGSTFSFEIVFETIDASEDMPDRAKFNMLKKPRFDALVLICDDNALNQLLICEHLANVGIRTVVADNGKIGVEKVQERIRKGEKPFDLIFMDMFMPVMGGIEAATKIMELNTGTPIVAVTANVMAGELENYRNHGIPDCLGKPFTSQELWLILVKYLPPVGSSLIHEDEYTQKNDALQKTLRINFVKYNRTIYAEIAEAIAAGDIKLAHRLAHTLKGTAGQIGETGLQNAAEAVEALLKDETVPVSRDSLRLLEAELMMVLEKLAPLLEEAGARKEIFSLSAEQTSALFEKLGPMLKKRDSECMRLLADIRAVPGAEELARQIEQIDFRSAFRTLEELKNKGIARS